MKQPIKMIVTDLDGTLLKTDKTISERTQSVLSRCRELSIKVVYATGRGGLDTEIVLPCLFDGRITMNGAIAKADGEVIYTCLIPFQIARPFLEACNKRGLRIVSQAEDMHYSNFVISDEWPWITNFKVVDFLQHDRDAEKIYTYDLTPEDVAFIEDQLPDDLYMVIAVDGLAMIMHKNATKSKAIAALAQYWGIVKPEIVAFGDDLNDIDMFAYAGVSVAMGNAVEMAKNAADCVCLSNDEDGMAQWIVGNLL